MFPPLAQRLPLPELPAPARALSTTPTAWRVPRPGWAPRIRVPWARFLGRRCWPLSPCWVCRGSHWIEAQSAQRAPASPRLGLRLRRQPPAHPETSPNQGSGTAERPSTMPHERLRTMRLPRAILVPRLTLDFGAVYAPVRCPALCTRNEGRGIAERGSPRAPQGIPAAPDRTRPRQLARGSPPYRSVVESSGFVTSAPGSSPDRGPHRPSGPNPGRAAGDHRRRSVGGKTLGTRRIQSMTAKNGRQRLRSVVVLPSSGGPA